MSYLQIWIASGGNFDSPVVVAVHKKIFGAGAATYPNQVPYIVVWRDLLTDLPSWIRVSFPEGFYHSRGIP